jgi:hypothetical protein
VEWSLDGPLPKLGVVIPTSNQDGHQAKNRKKGNEILIVNSCGKTNFHFIFQNHFTLIKWGFLDFTGA